MTVLILYASVEGQTGKIARFAADQLDALGQPVKMIEIEKRKTPVSFDKADRVILAASVHERRHPRAFEKFVADHKTLLAKLPTLFLSVSLNAGFPEGLDEAQEYVTEMKMRTGLDPDREMLVPGAVRYKRYDFYAKMVVRHVLLRGRNVDPDADEHEFTDWTALNRAVTNFLDVKAKANTD